MKSFKDYIVEEDNKPQEARHILNKRQMNALHKHEPYHAYVSQGGFGGRVYGKTEKNDSGPGYTRNVILTNAQNKHKMHVAITHHGKILSHSIYYKNKDEHGKHYWQHIRTVDGG